MRKPAIDRLLHSPFSRRQSVTAWPAERRLLQLALLLGLSLVPALVGQGQILALETHEVFVARTAEELIAAREVLVPTFDGRPRVNKPPLSYWLVALTDWVIDGDGDVSPWEARAPSVIAGVVLVLSAWSIGLALFDEGTAFVGGLLVAGSAGYAAYTHSARPDMLYAAACAAALAGYVWAFRWTEKAQPRLARRAASVAVVALIIASLTKGPYIPLTLVLSLWLALRRTGRTALIAAALHPVIATIAIVGVFLGWYALMFALVPDAGASFADEIGTRLVPEAWWRWFNPYYLYQTAGLAAPWIGFYALALATPWLNGLQTDRGARLLWIVVVVHVLAWQVLPGRRAHYTLPALAPLGPLMAVAAHQFARDLFGQRRGVVWRILIALHLILLAVLTGVPWFTHAAPYAPAGWAVATIVLLATGAALAVMRRRMELTASLVVLASVAIAGLAALTAHASLWDAQQRHNARSFFTQAAQLVARDAPLVAVKHRWYTQPYYMKRSIPVLRTADELDGLMRTGNALYVLAPGTWDPPPHWPIQTLLESDLNGEGKPRDTVRLYRVGG